jgi:hypothetical protein
MFAELIFSVELHATVGILGKGPFFFSHLTRTFEPKFCSCACSAVGRPSSRALLRRRRRCFAKPAAACQTSLLNTRSSPYGYISACSDASSFPSRRGRQARVHAQEAHHRQDDHVLRPPRPLLPRRQIFQGSRLHASIAFGIHDLRNLFTFSQHRITLKKRFGLLPTQQPGMQF